MWLQAEAECFNFAIKAITTLTSWRPAKHSSPGEEQKNDARRTGAMADLAAKSKDQAVVSLPTWPDEVYRTLKQVGVQQVAMVPDAGHSRLIRSFEADPETRVVTLTTEEEGVAMLAGAWLGGQRGVLLLQSSGVGNCINMLSLPAICHMPLLMIVTMRGDWGEFNPWQIPMGQGTQAVLEAMGVIVTRADEPDQVASTVLGAANLAFNTWRPAAVLIGQRVLGAKNFKELARK
jgi:sulfopyruvate decarboxylase alpha subunit